MCLSRTHSVCVCVWLWCLMSQAAACGWIISDGRNRRRITAQRRVVHNVVLILHSFCCSATSLYFVASILFCWANLGARSIQPHVDYEEGKQWNAQFYCVIPITEIDILLCHRHYWNRHFYCVIPILFCSHLFSFSNIKLSWSLLLVALCILALGTNVSALLNIIRVARSKVWVCGRSLAAIDGSNPAGALMSCLVSVMCRQVEIFASGWWLVQRIPTKGGVSTGVWSWTLDNEEALAF